MVQGGQVQCCNPHCAAGCEGPTADQCYVRHGMIVGDKVWGITNLADMLYIANMSVISLYGIIMGFSVPDMMNPHKLTCIMRI